MTQLINLSLVASRSTQDAGVPDPSGAEPGALSQSGFTFAQQFELNIAALRRQDSTEVDSQGATAASGDQIGKLIGKQIGNQSGEQLPVFTATELPATAYVQRLPSGTPVVLGEARSDEKTLKDFAELQGMNADALAVLFGRYSDQAAPLANQAKAAEALEVESAAEFKVVGTVVSGKDAASFKVDKFAELTEEKVPEFRVAASVAADEATGLSKDTASVKVAKVAELTEVAEVAKEENAAAFGVVRIEASAKDTQSVKDSASVKDVASVKDAVAVKLAPNPAAAAVSSPVVSGKGTSEAPVENIGEHEFGRSRSILAQSSQAAVSAPTASATSAAADIASLGDMPMRFRQQALAGVAAKTTPPSDPLKLATSAKVADAHVADVPVTDVDALSTADARITSSQPPNAALSAALANTPGLAPKPLRNQVVMSGAAFTLSAEHMTESLRVQSGTSAAPAAPEASTAAAPSSTVLLEDLPNKLSEMVGQRLMANIRGGSWRFDLQLHPQELGTLDVQMEMRDGRLEAQISTSSAAVKEFLGSQLQRLDDSLNAAGFKGSSIDVALHQGRSDNGSQGERRGHSDGAGATESGQEAAQSPSLISDSDAIAGLDLFV